MATAAWILACAAALLSLLWLAQRRLVYFPIAYVPTPDEMGLSGVEAVRFVASDGVELEGWFVAAPGSTPRPTVVVFNGNAGNRAYRAPLADALRRHGLHVLLTDYRGYGGNPGRPTERGLALDSRAALSFVTRRPEVDASRLVYFGESLGSAVAVELAAEHPPAALVLRSPFTSLAEVGQYHYSVLPVRLLLRDRFAAIDRIRRIRSPLLVILGSGDRIVPPTLSQQLYDAASQPKTLLVVPGADHNDYELLAGERMMRGVAEFLQPLTTP